jgi:NAD(P)-dependent dehydrogenase (short-subunit alcohol dehydrogenase family)
MDGETVVVAGVGPGLGASIARAFAAEGCRVALLARTESFVEDLATDLPDSGDGLAVPCDLTDAEAVREAFASVRAAFGPVDTLVNHASGGAWKGLTDLAVEELDYALEVGVRGGFVCAQEAVEDMLDGDGGTVIFTGATSAVRGRDGALAFSAAKFGVRGMAESMARELGPEGVHVAHVVVDGGIRPPDGAVDDPESYLDPDEIAKNYVHLAEQGRSAWTLELDVRPHVEEF